MKICLKQVLFVGLTVFLAVCSAEIALAQQNTPILVPSTDPRITAGQAGPLGSTGSFGSTGSTGTTSSTGSTAGGGGSQTSNVNTAATSGSVDPTNAVNLATSEDTRNQGFVGATGTAIQGLGFVGATSETSGPALAAGASFGGGVNGSSGGGGARAVGGGLQQQGFGGVGTQNGFSVTRQNLRAKLVPRFSTPQVSGTQIESRFNAGFNRLPTTQNFSGQYQVSVNGTTATISGFASSRADSERLIRQLRLQPGIYQIVNQLQIGQ